MERLENFENYFRGVEIKFFGKSILRLCRCEDIENVRNVFAGVERDWIFQKSITQVWDIEYFRKLISRVLRDWKFRKVFVGYG